VLLRTNTQNFEHQSTLCRIVEVTWFASTTAEVEQLLQSGAIDTFCDCVGVV